jgi:hypothetical protein
MEVENPLPNTGPYPDESSQHTVSLKPILMLFCNLRLRFLSDLLSSEFMAKILHPFHISPMRPKCSVNPIVPDLIIAIT